MKKNLTNYLFYALVGYVLFQFLWWEVLLARQSRQIADEEKKISALHFADKTALEENLKQIDQKKDRQLWMHVGEGTVFLILLSLGVLKIYNTRKKENELNQLQNNFLLSVTHELKSPLASVKLQLETLQKRQLDEDTKSKLLKKALDDNERLLRMIDNILTAARSEQKETAVNLQRINVSELTKQIVSQSFPSERINLTIEKDIFITADELLFAVMLSNLIENALKYSPAYSPVDITVSAINNKAVIAISDEGNGISANEKERVFEKFYRSGNEETRTAKGTGLGLYIVRSLAELQQAEVAIDDNKPKGSVFKLLFERD